MLAPPSQHNNFTTQDIRVPRLYTITKSPQFPLVASHWSLSIIPQTTRPIPSSQNAAPASSSSMHRAIQSLANGICHLAARPALADEGDASVALFGQETSENACKEIRRRTSTGQSGRCSRSRSTRDIIPSTSYVSFNSTISGIS
ncbi:hypothetical protein BDP27DRAFT_1432346 [Rhodocollybia butyracea]|uniref:Uncharacterized protein n=1 Tax=Rhodocollybia butyracea TaxID=206335 RepID=A0A9P5P7L1_9AGAR|nr:hypothetical protein BDP27DRAFT_1432346 [Rhodocollybia butyracea]